MTDRRPTIVVTGMGAITAVGSTAQDFWQAALEGRSGVRPITRFDVSEYPWQVAAMVEDLDASPYLNPREARRTHRFVQLAIVTAHQALDDAGLDLAMVNPDRAGIEIGTGIGGIGLIEEEALVLHEQGYWRVNPLIVPTFIPNMAACHTAIKLGIKGPANAPVAACAASALAIGDAANRLRRGEADVMLAGGTESAMSPLGLVSFGRLGPLSTDNDPPERICRPFDITRAGTVIGEGAAILILETLEHAQQRGARILAEVAGSGFTCDGYHLVAPDPSGEGAARAMQRALADAGIDPSEVDYICAHGTGTQLNDPSETQAIKTALGPAAYQTPISSIKPIVGHMLGGAGAISAVTAVQALRTGVLPPTTNLETPDPECDLDYVPHTPRKADPKVALVNAFGFGGQNVCVAFRQLP
jgi:3-oxoacyl-[acyl-carrier-protein] synthase II